MVSIVNFKVCDVCGGHTCEHSLFVSKIWFRLLNINVLQWIWGSSLISPASFSLPLVVKMMQPFVCPHMSTSVFIGCDFPRALSLFWQRSGVLPVKVEERSWCKPKLLPGFCRWAVIGQHNSLLDFHYFLNFLATFLENHVSHQVIQINLAINVT